MVGLLFSHADVHGRQSQIMRSMQYMQYNKQVIFDDFRDCYVIICYVINEWRNCQIVDHSRLFRWRKIEKGLFEISEHWNFKKNENYCWGLRSIGPTPWNSLICTVFLPHRYIYMLKYTYFPIHIDKAYSKKIEIFEKFESWWCVLLSQQEIILDIIVVIHHFPNGSNHVLKLNRVVKSENIINIFKNEISTIFRLFIYSWD